MNHTLAAAQHARMAAHHLAAGGDRAGYWRLLGEAEMCVGRDGLSALSMALAYEHRTKQNPPTPECQGAKPKDQTPVWAPAP